MRAMLTPRRRVARRAKRDGSAQRSRAVDDVDSALDNARTILGAAGTATYPYGPAQSRSWFTRRARPAIARFGHRLNTIRLGA